MRKNFNLRQGTWLYGIEDGEKKLLAQDHSADSLLIQLLDAVLPSKGTSKPSQWGAFQWLWVPQSNRELPTDKDGDPTIALHLETAEGKGVLVTQKFQAVQNSVLKCFSQYFSRTGKTTIESPIRKIEEEIQNLEEKSSEYKSKIEKSNDEKQQLENIEIHLPVLERKVEETAQELEKAKQETVDFTLIKTQHNEARIKVVASERDVEDAKKALKELKDSAKNIEELQKRENQARKDYSKIELRCEQIEKKLKGKSKTVEENAERIRLCEELAIDARILWAKFDIEKKIEDLKKRLMRIEKIDDQIESFRKKEISNVPTDLEIQDFIKWQIQIEVLKESLIDKGLGVRITPGVKGSLEVEIDGEKITDKKFTATGTESVSISSPNLGNVIVTAKLENARDAKSDIVNLEERIVDVFKKYSVNSVSDLKEKRKVQTEISGKLKELNAERKGVDERSKSELKHEMEKLTREIREIQDSKRTPKAIKLNPLDVNLGELIKKRENEEKECRTELDNARNERDSFDKDLTDVKEEIAQLRAGQNYIAEDLHTARDHERNVVR
ncbi:hypothetical protein IIB79_05840, partial [candidate division KSB1 bacterium]|nr:hypothetical protein [candidate division KSB1 bacterium]